MFSFVNAREKWHSSPLKYLWRYWKWQILHVVEENVGKFGK